MSNYSRQREEIIRIIKKLNNHVSAEEVYMKVKAEDQMVSRSTVYRNLNLLAEQGIIDKISIIDEADRFEICEKKHGHFVCKMCKKIYEFDFDEDTNIFAQNIKKQIGAQIYLDQFSLSGICNECNERCNNEQNK